MWEFQFTFACQVEMWNPIFRWSETCTLLYFLMAFFLYNLLCFNYFDCVNSINIISWLIFVMKTRIFENGYETDSHCSRYRIEAFLLLIILGCKPLLETFYIGSPTESLSRHQRGPIEGPSWTPRHNSAVIFVGFQGGP